MGLLEHLDTQRRQVLAPRTLIGRNKACLLSLGERFVSNEHALLWFEDGAWWVRDLGSRNGTWVGDERLDAMSNHRLEAEVELAFGDPKHRWRLAQAEPPGPVAERLTDQIIVSGSVELLLLPSAGDPIAAVFCDEHNTWMVELEGESRPASDHEVLIIDEQPYRLMLPVDDATTWQRDTTTAPQLRLRVSQDQEYVEVEVIVEGQPTKLPAKAHHALVLTLAQIRQTEVDASETEQGWVYIDQLCDMLRIDRRTINQYVFRARRELTACGSGLAAKIIERRTTTDQIRLGIGAIEITELDGR